MPTPSSQGTTCAFDSITIGRVTRLRLTPGSAEFYETTHAGSVVVGADGNARVVKTYDCVAIDPGDAEVTLYGCPEHAPSDIGHLATLSISFDGGSYDLPAYLETYEVTGQVGEFLVGRATFKIQGENIS